MRSLVVGPVCGVGLFAGAARADFVGVRWNGAEVYRIDGVTGAVTLIGDASATNSALNSLARAADGRYYTILREHTAGPSSLVRFTVDASLQFSSENLGTIDLNDIRSMAALNDGTFLVSGATGAFGENPGYYRLNPATLTSTLVAATPLLRQGLGQDSAGRVYVWETDTGLSEVDPATGATTDINPSVGGQMIFPQSLAFGPDGSIYLAEQTKMWRVNPATGVAAFMFNFNGHANPDIRGVEWVPGPGVVGVAGAWVIVGGRRRRGQCTDAIASTTRGTIAPGHERHG